MSCRCQSTVRPEHCYAPCFGPCLGVSNCLEHDLFSLCALCVLCGKSPFSLSLSKALLSPLPSWADRGRQNGIVATIRPPPLCHSERREESKIHNHKAGRPEPLLYHDRESKRCKNSQCQVYVVTDILDSSTPLHCAQSDSEGPFSHSWKRIDGQLPPNPPFLLTL